MPVACALIVLSPAAIDGVAGIGAGVPGSSLHPAQTGTAPWARPFDGLGLAHCSRHRRPMLPCALHPATAAAGRMTRAVSPGSGMPA